MEHSKRTLMHLNALLVDSCLRVAKEKGNICCIVMLALAKAFDIVRQDHIRCTIQSLSLPINLQNLLISLVTSNSTKIEVNKQTTNCIILRR